MACAAYYVDDSIVYFADFMGHLCEYLSRLRTE